MKALHNKDVNGMFLILLLTLLTATSCINRLRVGETQTLSESVVLGDASKARVEINMGAGELNIGSGAESLVDAEFVYNIEEWEPELNYEVRGDTGNLLIEQASSIDNIGVPDDDVEYIWNIELGQNVPLEMNIQFGAGRGNLELMDLDVTRLDLSTGAGEFDIAVAGQLADLDLQAGAGEIRLDLRGDWQEDLDASIRGGVGQIAILLPSGVGVRVNVRQGIGSVEATGLIRDGDDYVNEAFGESEVTLDIDVEGGVGEIVLEVSE